MLLQTILSTYLMERLCRTCMVVIKDTSTSISIYEQLKFWNVQYDKTAADMLSVHCNVQVSDTDRLPRHMCIECVEELVACTKFREKCCKSDQSFRYLLRDEPEGNINLDINCKTTIKPEPLEKVDLEREYGQPEDGYNEEDAGNHSNYYNKAYTTELKCCLCSVILHNKEEYTKHAKTLHGGIVTKRKGSQTVCFVCGQQFNTIEKLECHQNKILVETYECVYCKTASYSTEAAELHFQDTHSIKVEPETRIQEDQAQPKIADPEPVKRERKKKIYSKLSPEERYCCIPHCYETFTDKSALIQHAKQNHKGELQRNKEKRNPAKQHTCAVCFRSFVLARDLWLHESRRYSCTQCPFRAINRNHLATHQRLKHSGDRPFACDQCDKKFVCKTHLTAHLIRHSSDRPFECDICGKTFNRKDCIKTHIQRSHLKTKAFKCANCPSRFTSAQILDNHAARHFTKRPNKCSHCKKSFYQTSNRDLHELAHSKGDPNEKHHVCNTCGVIMKTKNSIILHQRIHGEGPYRCDNCGKAYFQKLNLNKHVQHCRK